MALANDEDPLCCCEYYNIKQQRTHLLSFCCECDELDKTVDDWIKGNPQKANWLVCIMKTFADRCRIPWYGGARTFDFGLIFPSILLTLSAFVASWHFALTMLVFLALPACVILCYTLTIKLKIRTKLFVSFTICSNIGCYLVYFYYVATSTNFHNNVLIIVIALLTTILFKKLHLQDGCKVLEVDNHNFSQCNQYIFCFECNKRVPFRGKHCRLCKLCTTKYDHHCVWIDACIGQHNHKIFLLMVGLFLTNILFGGYVTLLYVCQWEFQFIPDCSNVYANDSSSLVFVCCCYTLIIGVALAILLIQQIILISFNVTSYEWRHMNHRKSFCSSLMTSPYNKGALSHTSSTSLEFSYQTLDELPLE